jgi:MFS family permease
MVTTDRTKWFALALLCAVQFMVILDVSIVNVALPSIQEDLGFSQDNLQWVLSAYALVFGGFLLLGGSPTSSGAAASSWAASSSSRSARSSAAWPGAMSRSSARVHCRGSARPRSRRLPCPS